MRKLLKKFIVVSLIFLSISCSIEKDNRPNILFIMSDDHAYQAISAYDDRLIDTPNIDRIADEGMLFTNASVTNSICAPSRHTDSTGDADGVMHQLSQCLLFRILKFATAPLSSRPCISPSARGVDLAACRVTQWSASNGVMSFL